MYSLRGSSIGIPTILTNLIESVASSCTPSGAGIREQNHSTSMESVNSLSDVVNSSTESALISEKSLPIPASLVKEHWRLIFNSDASEQDLRESINHCKDLVLMFEENSEERRWLVRHLVDLRYSFKELIEAKNDKLEAGPSVNTVVGHHFTPRKQRVSNIMRLSTAIQYCDHCTGIIWSVVQASYECLDCHYMAHQKCLDKVNRVCAHVTASERQYPILDICPEIGLAAQHYKCAECGTCLNFKNSWIESRLCDYTGFYYCPSCHWNDMCVIPARVIHNWDFGPRKVSRSALQELNLFLDKPLIRLEDLNPKLFVFIEKLATLKKLRQNLVYMRKYLSECRQAIDDKIVDLKIECHRHLIQSNEFYSVNDLEQSENGILAEKLYKVFNCFDNHIRNCSLCTAKAYICEICSNNEVIFPFDDGCIICDKCNSIYHRVCMTRKNMICPKCIRLQERRLQRELGVEKNSASDDAAACDSDDD